MLVAVKLLHLFKVAMECSDWILGGALFLAA